MAKRGSVRSTKTQKVMKRGNSVKYFIIPLCMCFIVISVYMFWQTNNKNSTSTNIEYIRSFMSSTGKLNDFQNKLMMHDPSKDIRWYKTDEEIRIEFGIITMTWEPEEFYTEENIEALGSIGFTIDVKTVKDQKTLFLYWNGLEIERWVK